MTAGDITWMLGVVSGAALGFAWGWDTANARWSRAISDRMKDDAYGITPAMLREIADEMEKTR